MQLDIFFVTSAVLPSLLGAEEPRCTVGDLSLGSPLCSDCGGMWLTPGTPSPIPSPLATHTPRNAGLQFIYLLKLPVLYCIFILIIENHRWLERSVDACVRRLDGDDTNKFGSVLLR